MTIDVNGNPMNWISYLELVIRSSPETVRSYRKGICAYATWCDDEDVDPLTATRADLEAYVSTLTGAPATISQRMYCLRSFYRWLRDDRKLIATSPMDGIPVPKVHQTRTTPPSAVVCLALIDAHDESFRGLRDRAIVNLLYGCGLRVCEVRALTLDDVDTETRQLRVNGKGGTIRHVPIPTSAARALDTWLRARGIRPGNEYVFPGATEDGKRGYEAIHSALKTAATRMAAS